MRKKIVIAVDQSLHSKQAMEYAVKIAEVVKEVDFTLLHIQPMISQYLTEEAIRHPKARAELEKVYEKNKKASHQLLEDCKAHMAHKGIDVNCIEIKTQARSHSVAGDILKMAEALPYDAIIVGRRGITGLHELFVGSVTSNLLAGSRVIPIWVVDGRIQSNKILIAVDYSSQSLRTVDHLAYIFSENREVQLQFLNIELQLEDICEIDTEAAQTAELEKVILNSNEKCVSDFSAKAIDILKKAGFTEDQASFVSAKNQFLTGKAILEAVKKGEFGTVVIGKTGTHTSRNMGRVANYIIQKMSDGVVWLVP
ncbi:MAG: universal stress protein [Deltaproteobacteria bacterium]|nr:universal stress protein [Deltaproteobacteria bacterium]